MAWIVGIIVLILAIRFWRVSLPILGIAVVAAVIWFINEKNEQDRRTAERERNQREIAQRIAAARSNASDVGREWEVLAFDDPAGDYMMPRMARIQSNDGLCWLTLEIRVNGSELAGLDCELLDLREWDDIEVKFDNYTTSDRMDLKSYSDSSNVYIPKQQATYSNYLQYDEFVRRLSSGKAVSIKVDSSNAGSHWITFSLSGSTEKIGILYDQQPIPKSEE